MLRITGGTIFDPANGINGEVRDLFIDQGRFVVQPHNESDPEDFLHPLFGDLYTMSFENYPVEMDRIEHPEIQECDSVS